MILVIQFRSLTGFFSNLNWLQQGLGYWCTPFIRTIEDGMHGDNNHHFNVCLGFSGMFCGIVVMLYSSPAGKHLIPSNVRAAKTLELDLYSICTQDSKT
jgi:hypothetical protein